MQNTCISLLGLLSAALGLARLTAAVSIRANEESRKTEQMGEYHSCVCLFFFSSAPLLVSSFFPSTFEETVRQLAM